MSTKMYSNVLLFYNKIILRYVLQCSIHEQNQLIQIKSNESIEETTFAKIVGVKSKLFFYINPSGRFTGFSLIKSAFIHTYILHTCMYTYIIIHIFFIKYFI